MTEYIGIHFNDDCLITFPSHYIEFDPVFVPKGSQWACRLLEDVDTHWSVQPLNGLIGGSYIEIKKDNPLIFSASVRTFNL